MTFLLWIAIAALAAEKPAVSIAKDTKTYHYDFSWSKEAKAIPALDRKLRARAAESAEEITADATEAAREAKKDGRRFPDVGYQSNWDYKTAGQSSSLLSLSGDWFTYTGGAHGMFGATALLWNRAAGKEIELSELFERVTELAMLHPRMCAALATERKTKRESEEKLDTSFDSIDEAFNGCPKFDEVTAWVADEDKDGRFDTVMFAVDPYVAGPYVEGMYEMRVPVTARMIAALKPGYRPSFEVQGRQ